MTDVIMMIMPDAYDVWIDRESDEYDACADRKYEYDRTVRYVRDTISCCDAYRKS